MMIQTGALLLDAYRELQYKKMFWVSLILTVLVMACFSVIGVNSHTITILWFEPMGDMTDMRPLAIYKWLYSSLVVGFWLTWAATILALISTAGLFPDFLSSGSVDLFLAKPISRLRLFFTKYVAGLAFVTLQVTVFTVMSFVILGLRAGLWEPGLLWAIPLVVLFFSYLYAISVLLGVLTRSAIAALLLTILAWPGIWVVDFVDTRFQQIPAQITMQHDMYQDMIDSTDEQLIKLKKENPESSSIPSLESQREMWVTNRDRAVVPPWTATAQQTLFVIKSFVPKTRETIGLLDRVLFNDKDLRETSKHSDAPGPETRDMPRSRRGRGPDMTLQVKLDRERPAWWVIGTSLIFEAGVLALAAWIFCRRDY